MKFIKTVSTILFLISSNFAQQDLSQEEIDFYISNLSNIEDDQSTAIEYFIKNKMVAVLPSLEQYFWQQKCLNQQDFLEGMYYLNSNLTHEYAIALFDSLNKPQKEKYDPNEKYNRYDCLNILDAKVRCIEILYYLGDYSKVDEVFELIERDREWSVNYSNGISLLPYIYKNRPDYKERAKQELMNAISTATDDYTIFSYSLSLTQAFGEEEIPEMIQIFRNSPSPQAKKAMLEFYFSNYEDKFDLNGLVKETLLTESNDELRLFLVKILLLGFAGSDDYEFVKNYIQSEPNDTIKALVQFEVNSFQPPPPDSSKSILELIGKLLELVDTLNLKILIGNNTFSDELKSSLLLAKTNLQNGDSLACAIDIKSFQDSVDYVYKDSLNTDPRFVTMEGWKFLFYNAQYILDRLPEPSSSPNLEVNLKSSTGTLLTTGSLQYYQGGWKDAVNNGDGTFKVNTELPSVSLRMTYEYASQTVSNIPAQNNTYTFQTVSTQVQLQDSQDSLIDTGTVQYYAGAWREFGTTVNGTATKELLPNNYSFRMSYAYASNDKQQDIGTNPMVVFQTVNAAVQLQNSLGNFIDQGTVQYYAGAWRVFGTTENGITTKELLPNNYSFRMSYAYASNDKQQDIGTNPTVVFQTVNAAVQLQNSLGNFIDQGTVQYYAGAWRELGTTLNGVTTKELLPNNYSFRMSYAFASNDKQQDIGANPTVVFQTVNAAVQLQNSLGNLIDQGTVQYYAGAWREFGLTVNGTATKELLPNNYSFRMNYEYISNDKQQNIGTNSTVTFSTVLCTVKVNNAQGEPINNADVKYYAGAWRNIGLTSNGEVTKELLPANISFRANYEGVQQDKTQNITTNNIVEIILNTGQ